MMGSRRRGICSGGSLPAAQNDYHDIEAVLDRVIDSASDCGAHAAVSAAANDSRSRSLGVIGGVVG